MLNYNVSRVLWIIATHMKLKLINCVVSGCIPKSIENSAFQHHRDCKLRKKVIRHSNITLARASRKPSNSFLLQ